MKKVLSLAAIAVITFSSCKKDPEPEVTPTPVTEDLNGDIINAFTVNVSQDIYNSLASKTTTLYNNVLALSTETTEANLTTCKQNWRDARIVWENSEAFLFGPVATENIDPRIDTWPVNFVDLDGQLASSEEFTESYIDGLADELKGFHPIEYLLFGQDGDKVASEITARELEYLVALANNLKQLTADIATGWDPSVAGNYTTIFTTPGSANVNYEDRTAVFEELVGAMAGICDEVANGKISEPFVNGDASLEESPFSGNSLTDFTNNIRGVELVYLGQFNVNGVGIEDLVRKHNLALDGEIKTRIANAIASLESISNVSPNYTFGQAIFEQGTLVQNSIDAINELKEVLEVDLQAFVAVYGNN